MNFELTDKENQTYITDYTAATVNAVKTGNSFRSEKFLFDFCLSVRIWRYQYPLLLSHLQYTHLDM